MADKEEGEGSASARAVVVDDDRSPENIEDNLSFLDKLKCMMYSKVERDAFLIEKLEKEEKKKAKAAKKCGECSESGCEGTKKNKPGFLGKMKTMLSSPKEEDDREQTESYQSAGATAGVVATEPQETSSANECSKVASGENVEKPQ